MAYQAILFDMDGVIVDTHRAVTTFWQQWSQVHQIQLSQADFQQNIYGCPATHTLDLLFPALDADERQAIIADMTEYEINQTYSAVKGVVPFLNDLKRQDIPIALATNSPSCFASDSRIITFFIFFKTLVSQTILPCRTAFKYIILTSTVAHNSPCSNSGYAAAPIPVSHME